MSMTGALSESEKKMLERPAKLNSKLKFELQLKKISQKNTNPMSSETDFVVFTDGEANKHKEDTNMKKSNQLESLIENIAEARIEIAIGCQSEFTLYKAIMRLRSVIQDAVSSSIFSDEKGSLMDLLGDLHTLQMRDITRDAFGKKLDDYLNLFSAKLKELKEEEEKEAFKKQLLENIDFLYEVHKRLNQE